MNYRKIENDTLGFKKPTERAFGSIQESFPHWKPTIIRWHEEGFPTKIFNKMANFHPTKEEQYMDVVNAEGIYECDAYFGLDPIKRLYFNLPFKPFKEEILQETDSYILKKEEDGWIKKYHKDSDMMEELTPVVKSKEDWENLKILAKKELDHYYSDENIEKIYRPYQAAHQRGDFSVRLCIQGFFWVPRTLFGIAGHMMAFYDYPDVIHEINHFVLDVYLNKLSKVLDIIPADTLYISEDLSGANGPMLSNNHFKTFLTPYYKQLIPMLKDKGVTNVIVDTDGNFELLIPDFIEAGIEGFCPMDVNAGMDIVAIRKSYPKLKFFGGYNKLSIANGPKAIDAEFERLLPVIRQGGYIPSTDHQVAPSTSLKDYRYYTNKLKEVMLQSGANL